MDLRLPRFRAALCRWPDDSASTGGRPASTADGTIVLDDDSGGTLSLRPSPEIPSVEIRGPGRFLLYLRLADGSLRPLQPAGGTRVIALNPGDAVVCVTENAAQVKSPDGEAFGVGRLAGFVHLHDNFTAASLAERLLAELAGHAEGRRPVQAVTCLVIEAR